jgi:hypothetical protein
MLVTDVHQSAASPASRRSTAHLPTARRDLCELESAAMMSSYGNSSRANACSRAARRHALSRPILRVSVPVPRLREPGDVADLVRRFHDAHQRRYGHMARLKPSRSSISR